MPAPRIFKDPLLERDVVNPEDDRRRRGFVRRSPWRILGAAVAAVPLVLLPSGRQSYWILVGAFVFGVMVRRPWALLLAFVPFLIVLSQDSGGGDQPAWAGVLVLLVPILALVIGSGVLVGCLGQRLARHFANRR
jgi:hypothetical protein